MMYTNPEQEGVLGRRTIKEFRREHGWTQAELARRIAVSKMSVSHWETGRNDPSARQVRALAEAFGVPMERIAFERELALSRQEETKP